MEQLLVQFLVGILIAIPVVTILSRIENKDVLLRRIITLKERGSAKKTRMAAVEDEKKSEKKKQLEKYLKISEQAKNSKNIPLEVLLSQSGLDIKVSQYYIASAVITLVVFFVLFIKSAPIFVSVPAGLVAGFFLPRSFITGRINKREKDFLKSFPEALDIIIRGVKSGYSVNQSITLVSEELRPPISTEFGMIVDNLKVGLSLEQSMERFYNRNPSREARFFSILLVIQSKSGGNLSEALNNLATLLRDRAALLMKVQALSSEAKASAMIMGIMPLAIAGFIYMQQPNYFDPFFVDTKSKLVLVGTAVWMGIGFLVMKLMMKIKV